MKLRGQLSAERNSPWTEGIDGGIETQEVNFRRTGRVIVENAEIETQGTFFQMFRIVLLFWKFIFFRNEVLYVYRDCEIKLHGFFRPISDFFFFFFTIYPCEQG